jgi:hypothetical protein
MKPTLIGNAPFIPNMFQKLFFTCTGILNFEPVRIAPVYAQALLRRRLC